MGGLWCILVLTSSYGRYILGRVRVWPALVTATLTDRVRGRAVLLRLCAVSAPGSGGGSVVKVGGLGALTRQRRRCVRVSHKKAAQNRLPSQPDRTEPPHSEQNQHQHRRDDPRYSRHFTVGCRRGSLRPPQRILRQPMGDSFFNCCYFPPQTPGEEEHPRSRVHNESRMASHSGHISPDKRFLIIFDFDETIVDETSDDMVVQTAPSQHLPSWLKDTYQPGRYNDYMQRVLAYLSEQGVTESDIRGVMEKLPATPGMLTLFQFLRSRPSHDFEVILVSDANTFFIESWLRRAGARPLFHRIFSNPATFNRDGRLVLRPFHTHDCQRCPENMCKQAIIREYVTRRTQERGRPYHRVFYVGDGANDFCPALALGPRDVAFPRRDFPMHRLITETHESMPGEFKAVTVPWATAEDVVQRLRKMVTE